MHKLDVLEIRFKNNDAEEVIYPVVLSDDDETILIDCGYPHFLPLIKEAFERKKLDMNQLTKVIITHHDFDHIGSLAQLKREYPHVKILASVHEVKYITGEEKSLRLQQAEAIYHKLPKEERGQAKLFHSMLESIESASVDIELRDRDCFPWCGGIEVIETPGHMPGHISIYMKDLKTLISGDALVVEGGSIGIANPQYILDMNQAKNSIKKLLNYNMDAIICYHGGIYTKDIKESLEHILYSC